MTRTVEAIYENGVLKPVERLELADQERVTVIVQTHDQPDSKQRALAVERLLAGIQAMNFRSTGPYPTRDELHERR